MIPNEAEVENAINFIEDEIMSQKELVNQGENLVNSNQLLIDVFDIHEKGVHECSRKTVEELFTQYALLSMGNIPFQTHLEISHEKYAILLVLREIVHHLKFDAIQFVL